MKIIKLKKSVVRSLNDDFQGAAFEFKRICDCGCGWLFCENSDGNEVLINPKWVSKTNKRKKHNHPLTGIFK
jgi:predicted RNA-binding Zn ribbon-like protein